MWELLQENEVMLSANTSTPFSRYLPVALVAVTTLGEPIGSSILAFVILKETPSLLQIIGGILILIGIYVTSQKSEN